MKILITGARGFTAKYLIPVLSILPDTTIFLSDLNENDSVQWIQADMADYASACKVLRKSQPDQIYHLAGLFTNDYDKDYRSNVIAAKNIFDCILEMKLSCRVLLIGSSAEYGFIQQTDNPIKEDHPLSPVSIYGLSKVILTHLMKYYAEVHNLDLVMARTFNLLGKGASNRLFIGRIYDQIDEYKKGNITAIKLGNLNNKRDYIEIGDAVGCYQAIMNHGIAGNVYNVGSGKSIKTIDLLESILKENDLTLDIVAYMDNMDQNKIDIPEIYADMSKTYGLSVQNQSAR